MNLKAGAVYRLPDGRELVAYTTCGDEILLLSINASEPGLYELDSEGRLLCDDELTAWHIDDLVEPDWVAGRE
jgi:hypothetical protein